MTAAPQIDRWRSWAAGDAVPPPCPLPHAGRDVALLAGLSAAAEQIRGLRWAIGGLVRLAVQLHLSRHAALVEGQREAEDLAAEWRRARAAEWERAEALEAELVATLAGARALAWQVLRLAGRLNAALLALPALEAAAASGGRRELAAALQPLARALRGTTEGKDAR